MITEEQQQYINETEPDLISTDGLGRWTERIWQLENSQIIERYEYKHSVQMVQANPKGIRNSFAVKSVTAEEVSGETIKHLNL